MEKCELCSKEVESVEQVRIAERPPRKLCAECVRISIDALNKTTGQELLFDKKKGGACDDTE